VETAFSVFVNGIGGVFAGMAVLYVTMKIISLVAGSPTAEPNKD
jgi:Na+-transporting methylmalonyl-CoA/oxaloacetate decarboxylase gamma subunit